MKATGQMRFCLIFCCLLAANAFAGPYMPAGDLALRHDIQILADAGVIKGPTSTWPLAWGPILANLADADAMTLSLNEVTQT